MDSSETNPVVRIVLVGTYKGNQLEKWRGWYCYPVSDEDKALEDSASRINELWLFKLISQMVDLGGETDATAFDESTRMDWGANDVLVYLQTKYRKQIYGGGEPKGLEK